VLAGPAPALGAVRCRLDVVGAVLRAVRRIATPRWLCYSGRLSAARLVAFR